MDVVDSEDIFDLIIVGAGPHGLATAARLREPRPSALYNDVESSRLSFLRRFARPNDQINTDKSLRGLRILVIDKAGNQWMSQWHRLFQVLDIKHLRSPMFFHPDPSDLDALLAFSHGQSCGCDAVQITGVVGKERSKHKVKKNRVKKCKALTTDFNERERQDYFSPSTKTFRDFCLQIVDRYALHDVIVQGEVQHVDYLPIHEKHVGPQAEHFAVTLAASSRKLFSRALVLAPGVGGRPNLPTQLSRSPRLESWCHSSDLSGSMFPPARLAGRQSSAILIIGGGLTSAQIVDLAIRRGITKVHLVMRSHLKIKHFDLDLTWLGKIGNLMKMQFYQSEFEDRAKTVLSARNGGSITPTYAKLLAAHQNAGTLCCHTLTTIKRADCCEKTRQWSVDLCSAVDVTEAKSVRTLNHIDYIVCATGTRPDFAGLPFMQSLLQKFPVQTSSGLPHLTEDLQLQADLPLFVASGYAALQLGPGAFNLSGSREGAERIVNRLQELYGSREDGEGVSDDLERLAGNQGNYFNILTEG